MSEKKCLYCGVEGQHSRCMSCYNHQWSDEGIIRNKIIRIIESDGEDKEAVDRILQATELCDIRKLRVGIKNLINECKSNNIFTTLKHVQHSCIRPHGIELLDFNQKFCNYICNYGNHLHWRSDTPITNECLRQRCKENGIKRYSKMNKKQLIKALMSI